MERLILVYKNLLENYELSPDEILRIKQMKAAVLANLKDYQRKGIVENEEVEDEEEERTRREAQASVRSCETLPTELIPGSDVMGGGYLRRQDEGTPYSTGSLIKGTHDGILAARLISREEHKQPAQSVPSGSSSGRRIREFVFRTHSSSDQLLRIYQKLDPERCASMSVHSGPADFETVVNVVRRRLGKDLADDLSSATVIAQTCSIFSKNTHTCSNLETQPALVAQEWRSNPEFAQVDIRRGTRYIYVLHRHADKRHQWTLDILPRASEQRIVEDIQRIGDTFAKARLAVVHKEMEKVDAEIDAEQQARAQRDSQARELDEAVELIVKSAALAIGGKLMFGGIGDMADALMEGTNTPSSSSSSSGNGAIQIETPSTMGVLCRYKGTAQRNGIKKGECDSSGSCVIENLDPGKYDLYVNSYGTCIPRSKTVGPVEVTVPPNTKVKLDFRPHF